MTAAGHRGPAADVVVIVDAFDDERQMYEQTLRHAGYAVVPCEKFDDIRRVVQEASVAAVITRIVQAQGADWDGVELTRQLKRSDHTRHIPVVVITTRIEPHWRLAADQAGCDSFLLLPCLPDKLLAEIRRVASIPPRRPPLGSASPADGDARLVWRLRSPSARQLTCKMRRTSDRLELFITDDDDRPLIGTSFEKLTELHQKAAQLRGALEVRGYVPAGSGRADAPMRVDSEARTAFRGLIECAELLSLDQRDAGAALRDAATMGLVAVGLNDPQTTKDAIARAKDALVRARGRRATDEALLRSCDALLEQVEWSLP